MTSHVDNGDNRCSHRLRRSLSGKESPTSKGLLSLFTASPQIYICSGAICGDLMPYLHCDDGQHLTEGETLYMGSISTTMSVPRDTGSHGPLPSSLAMWAVPHVVGWHFRKRGFSAGTLSCASQTNCAASGERNSAA